MPLRNSATSATSATGASIEDHPDPAPDAEPDTEPAWEPDYLLDPEEDVA